jgi:hypothetical protein
MRQFPTEEAHTSIIIATDQLKARLDWADGPIEFCAADGKRFGDFTPSKPKHYRLEPPGSEEELDRREAAGGGRPLKDILRDLKNRG